ncbi:MerR family transcriptional regulator [Lapillicoccus jejuensis]|uniref:MerR-like DNA binding protein n=1 Tax=Lapillicoccus jejuensis TaxID=402171 RepID=A0A542E4E0_9MICO|nr:MerR family transcriptional regulator [Lapillicoccus jejuensis]TQJ10210.1 MerR-like DNA binding protein [Lapillicoccus jejuensis]
MRVSELAAAADVPLATVKFYLREGLLMPGTATSRTRANYDEQHLERLRLVRALVETGGLGLREVRSVLAALDDPPTSPHELLGVAHAALPPPVAASDPPPDTAEVERFLEGVGWGDCLPPSLLASLAQAVAAVRAAGLALTPDELTGYADAAYRAAVTDVAVARRADSPAQALHTVIVGTVLVDEVLATLRRIAQQVVSTQALARTTPPDTTSADTAVREPVSRVVASQE